MRRLPLLALAACVLTMARADRTADAVFLRGVATALDRQTAGRGGAPPRSWAELVRVDPASAAFLRAPEHAGAAARFRWVDASAPIPELRGGRLVLVSAMSHTHAEVDEVEVLVRIPGEPVAVAEMSARLLRGYVERGHVRLLPVEDPAPPDPVPQAAAPPRRRAGAVMQLVLAGAIFALSAYLLLRLFQRR